MKLKCMLDGNYTRKLRAVLNIFGESTQQNKLYDNVTTFSSVIQEQRFRFAGYCWGCVEKLVSDVLWWTPNYGTTITRRPKNTYGEEFADFKGLKFTNGRSKGMERCSQDVLGNRPDQMKTVFDFAIETCNGSKNNDIGAE